MGRIIKALLMTILVVCAAVSIYFIITIIGNKDRVIDAYDSITSAKETGTDNIRTNFLRVYGTYGEELFIALGVKKSDYVATGIGDSDPGTPEQSETKFCTCTTECISLQDADQNCPVCVQDWTQCAAHTNNQGGGGSGGSGGGSGGSGGSGSGTPPTTGGPVTGNSYTKQGPDGLGYVSQGTTGFENFGNPGSGLSIADAGCGILALYHAYANNGGGKSFEQTILDAFPDRVEVVNGSLQNKPGKGFQMGVLTTDWSHYAQTLGISVGAKTNGTPTAPGEYIFRYLYGGGGEHNIFVRINSDGSYQAACSAGKGWAETIARSGFNPQYYVKVG